MNKTTRYRFVMFSVFVLCLDYERFRYDETVLTEQLITSVVTADNFGLNIFIL